ncbi:hypothetical protein PIB30_053893 [Stylosanthes scabra]|uniref:Uncharacterized protein n=1 Tax=Stylosanthes scabra TaxID=79078 RepID=A0ABU6VLR4_9FABA|nr:hypothetical protein [Stylosanthes scabra]
MQNHDWVNLHGRYVLQWNDRANRLMESEIPAYAAPHDDYMDWLRGFANDWLRLSGRVQGDAYMPEVPEEEPAEFGTADDIQQLRWMENFLMRTTPPEQSQASTDCVPQVRPAPTQSSGSSWSSAGVIPNPPKICHHPVDLNTHKIPLDPAYAVDVAQSDTRDEGPSGAGPGVEERYNLRDKDNRKAPKKYSPSPFQKIKNFTGFGKKK